MWDGIKIKIEIINGGKTSEYGKDFRKIIFGTDDDLSLNKPIKFLKIVATSVFKDQGKIYPQVYLNECLYEL